MSHLIQMVRDRVGLKVLALVVGLLLVGASIIGAVVLMIQSRALTALTFKNNQRIAEVITQSIEVSMVRGKTEVFQDLVEQLHNVSEVKDIEVYNAYGVRAFNKTAPAEAGPELETIRKTGQAFTQEKNNNVILFYPLVNSAKCVACHPDSGKILGAVKVEIDITDVRERLVRYLWFVLLGSLLGIATLSLALMASLRRMVLRPIRQVVDATHRLAAGDLAFEVNTTSTDEVGRMAGDLEQAMVKISIVFGRIQEVIGRVSKVTEQVNRDSRTLVDGTEHEAEAVVSISSAVVEMNTSMGQISESVETLSTSAEETSATAAEMVASTEHVAMRTRELYEAVDSTSVSIEQMSATINEVATAAGALSHSADETLAAIQEIAGSIKDVEASAKDATRLSNEVAQSAMEDGMEKTRRTTEGMSRIRESMGKTSDAIRRLMARSEDIGNILGVIDEVTDQTTLLSLNASILAAQAGAQGRGFAVVASQIKNLTARTTGSTQEIAEIIEAIRREIRETVLHMKDAEERVNEGLQMSSAAIQALERIVEAAGRSAEMVHSIENSTVEQSKNVRVVNGAVFNVRDRVGQIAKATSEQNKGVRLIVDSAERMRQLTSQVEKSTAEQSLSSRQISQAVEQVSEGILQISRAVREQKMGTDQILESVENIKEIPLRNRDIAVSINRALRDLSKDSELMTTEVGRFHSSSAGRPDRMLRMGVVPLESPAEMYRKFIPLVDYLSDRLGLRVNLKVPVNFTEAVNDLVSGATHLCFMTPTTYLSARDVADVELLVKAERSRVAPPHRSAIIVRSDSRIRSLADLKGRSFAFGDSHSTSSHVIPRGMLHDAGVTLSNLRCHEFLGQHDEVAEAVLRGDFDAGALMAAVAEKYLSRGLRVIAHSNEIPEFNICIARSVPPETRKRVRQALLSVRATEGTGRAILSPISDDYAAFVEARDEDYEEIREMYNRLGLKTGA